MLILDQTKTKLINLDHVSKFSATGGEVIAYSGAREAVKADIIGIYEDPSRAVAVLGEIAETYAKYIISEGGPLATINAYVQPMAFTPPKVYNMPEE